MIKRKLICLIVAAMMTVSFSSIGNALELDESFPDLNKNYSLAKNIALDSNTNGIITGYFTFGNALKGDEVKIDTTGVNTSEIVSESKWYGVKGKEYSAIKTERNVASSSCNGKLWEGTNKPLMS